ncbi:sulfite exporter TauE/SafE family protein [Mucilaginibacter sp. BJC16-A38]|uniref:sulfite exporter TauE/SafE family protein n=1 Tax=Mucilaginibacter phenanthrenivorans TaxID=1234842 RepID=UPI0021576804|nr:sulfite exporter TauE/SafE family protein [Mucilaginibacter phenanthrenivorans]MCR8559600.1 sulfite exporter TauE/SafE family protein [Mucilaginibacter phenanthrenivorans]
MSNNEIAFFIGLFGSVHCVGMCGPLALAVPSFQNRWWLIVFDKLLYNIGRIITYSFLGLLIGLIGKQLWLSGLQQGVSIVSGLLIILAGFSRIFKIQFPGSKLLLPVNRLLNYALRHKAGHLVVGLLNGFLPCGFVYLALVGAINTTSPIAASAYMFWFGIGTFPLMLLAMVSSGFISPAIRRHINKGMPYLMVCLGLWFMLRGMGLNIPYLSPQNQTSGTSICN